MDTITDTVTYAGLQHGDPPRLVFRKRLIQSGGGGRIHTEAVPMPDTALRERALAELDAGDEIVLSVEYDYSVPGWSSRVTDFHKVAVPEQHRTRAAA